MCNEVIKGVMDTMHPLRGGGVVESAVVVVVVLFVLYANYAGVKLTPEVLNLFSLVLIWLGWKMKENSGGDKDNG